MTVTFNDPEGEGQGYLSTSSGSPLKEVAAGRTAKPNILSAAGPITLARKVSVFAITGGANIAFTLADGKEGQEKILFLATKGGAGNAVITPAHFDGTHTTLTLDTALDLVHLIFLNGGWRIDVNAGATLA